MTLKLLAVKVPEELEKNINEIVKQEKLDKATVVRNLLETGMAEWRKNTALDLLQNGKVTFTKTAEIANFLFGNLLTLSSNAKLNGLDLSLKKWD